MSGRPTSHLAFHDHRARINAAQVLVFSLPAMHDQSEMYDRGVSAHCTLGARGRPGCDAAAPRPNATGFTPAPPDRRAPVRHDQSLDGSDALSDQDDPARKHRDELACTSLQHETCDADPRNRTTHGGNEGLNAFFFCRAVPIIPTLPHYSQPGPSLLRRILRVFARPRPVAAGCDRQVLEVYDSIFWEERLFLGTWPAQPELQGVD